MKKTNFKISVESPCEESWASMQPREKGQYCASCDKIVVDFSKMTDEEIIAYFANYKGGKICGRMSEKQMQKTFQKTQVPVYQSGWRRILAGVALVAALAQPSAMTAGIWLPATEMRTELAENDNETWVGGEGVVVKGEAVDAESLTAIAGATVYVKLKNEVLFSTTTDESGNFAVEIDQKLAKRGFKLEIVASGYEMATRHVSKNDQHLALSIKLKAEQMPVMWHGGIGYKEMNN